MCTVRLSLRRQNDRRALIVTCHPPCALHGDGSYGRPWQKTQDFHGELRLDSAAALLPSVYSATCVPQAWNDVDCAIMSSRVAQTVQLHGVMRNLSRLSPQHLQVCITFVWLGQLDVVVIHGQRKPWEER